MDKKYPFKNKQWLIENLDKYGTVLKLCRATGEAETSVRRFINRYGLQSHIKHPPQNHDNIFDYGYFHEIDTEEKAYWLGMLMADGNVMVERKKKSYRTSLLLKESDIYHVENFCRALSVDPKHMYVDKKGRGSITLFSKEMFMDLGLHGIHPEKTGRECVPELDDNLFRHFMRGFFDGDGTIYQRREKDPKRKRSMCAIGWCSASKKFMEDFHHKIFEFCGFWLPIHSKVLEKTGREFYETKTEAINKVSSLIHFMYDDATIFLKRKHDIAENFLNVLPNSGRKARVKVG